MIKKLNSSFGFFIVTLINLCLTTIYNSITAFPSSYKSKNLQYFFFSKNIKKGLQEAKVGISAMTCDTASCYKKIIHQNVIFANLKGKD